MVFKRCRDGTLSAYADGEKVGTVKSQALCSALFDLYLGDEPVSEDARSLAMNRVVNFVLDPENKHSAKAVRCVSASAQRSPYPLRSLF